MFGRKTVWFVWMKRNASLVHMFLLIVPNFSGSYKWTAVRSISYAVGHYHAIHTFNNIIGWHSSEFVTHDWFVCRHVACICITYTNTHSTQTRSHSVDNVRSQRNVHTKRQKAFQYRISTTLLCTHCTVRRTVYGMCIWCRQFMACVDAVAAAPLRTRRTWRKP